MRTLAQIDARLAEIRTALQNPETTDLDTLQNEMNQLLQERAQRVAEAEQRVPCWKQSQTARHKASRRLQILLPRLTDGMKRTKNATFLRPLNTEPPSCVP